MRWIIVAVVGSALMVHGQSAKPHSDTHTRDSAAKQTGATDTAGQSLIVVNQQAPQGHESGHTGKPTSYFHELLLPANLPNLLLVGVGITGIFIAICTLLAIKHQAVEMRRQRIEMRGQRNLMGHQLEAMREQTAHMEAQLSEMQKSREIETKTLILQYRPKIIVRNAKALQFSFDLGKPWECQFEFTVVNTGGSTAYIGGGTNIRLTSCIAHDLGSMEFKEGDIFWLKEPITLQPGAEVIIQESLPTGAIFDLGWENYRQGIQTSPRRYLFLFSRIHYVDDLKIPRSTSIYRGYDQKTKAFVPEEQEENEYSD